MKENTGTIIAMLEELLTISKSRQASQSGSTNAANMDIAPFHSNGSGCSHFCFKSAGKESRRRTGSH